MSNLLMRALLLTKSITNCGKTFFLKVMSYSYAMSSDRNERLKVYRAGSEKCPTFDDDVNTDEGK